ncbi:MAG: ComF family protein [Nitrospirae bacterium]|nr:ComF family protein [Nitrospirota bacterium]MBI3378587.1 ComF family protein [Nitrospirota bacterium]
MRDILKSRGYAVASRLVNLIYPSICPLCSNLSDSFQHSPICTNCWRGIKRYSGPSCRICAVPLVSVYAAVCKECLTHLPSFSVVLNYGIYSDALAEAINLMKFSGLRRFTNPLGKLLLNLEMPECDGIIPVPLSKNALRARGFNQSLLMARVISKNIKTPLYMDMLLKVRDTLPQVGLGAKERMKNLRGAFKTNGKINNLRLLLLDDVMTTGATARECSKTLMSAGAKEVIVITLARAGMM